MYIQRKEYPGQFAYKYSWQREERDINTNSTKDLWQPNQNVTGYKSRGAPIMCGAMPLDKLNTVYHFMLTFISLTKTQLCSLLCLQRTGTVINHREKKSGRD